MCGLVCICGRINIIKGEIRLGLFVVDFTQICGGFKLSQVFERV